MVVYISSFDAVGKTAKNRMLIMDDIYPYRVYYVTRKKSYNLPFLGYKGKVVSKNMLQSVPLFEGIGGDEFYTTRLELTNIKEIREIARKRKEIYEKLRCKIKIKNSEPSTNFPLRTALKNVHTPEVNDEVATPAPRPPSV